VEFLYTQNPQAKVPVMLLNKRIGRDADGTPGIMGDQVYKEVFALKNAGKTELDVWINSPGGSWYEGTQIYDALRSSGMKVNTYNKGVVDSTAGWILQAGDVRYWSNYGVGLVHEIQGAASDKTREAVNDSIATMYSSRSTKSKDEIRSLMSSNEVLNYQTAIAYGLADMLVNASDITALHNSSDANEVYNFGQKEIKNAFTKNSNMSTINTLLGLSNEATEEATREAISNLVNENTANKAKVNELSDKLANTERTLTSTTENLAAANSKITELENKSKRTEAQALVNEFVGKSVANEADVIERWVNLATKDLEGTEKLLKGLKVNATAPVPPAYQRPADAPVTNAAEYSGYAQRK
jgi:ATP-dependent protease ClpP protease subunit